MFFSMLGRSASRRAGDRRREPQSQPKPQRNLSLPPISMVATVTTSGLVFLRTVPAPNSLAAASNDPGGTRLGDWLGRGDLENAVGVGDRAADAPALPAATIRDSGSEVAIS
jgi:hypothetical protein